MMTRRRSNGRSFQRAWSFAASSGDPRAASSGMSSNSIETSGGREGPLPALLSPLDLALVPGVVLVRLEAGIPRPDARGLDDIEPGGDLHDGLVVDGLPERDPEGAEQVIRVVRAQDVEEPADLAPDGVGLSPALHEQVAKNRVDVPGTWAEVAGMAPP